LIKLQNVTVQFGDNIVLENFNLSVNGGEHIVLMGPSGSGKTTVLKLIAGQLKPAVGTVNVHAERISYMFQEHRLLPWLTATENVNLVLGDRQDTLPTARLWLERVGLGDAMNKCPHELSGGMRQRVALARALAYGGDLFLFDEPLSALDEDLSAEMLDLIKHYTEGKTVIFVTHNPTHAKRISDDIHYIAKENA